jgi:hypothetical protein
MANSASMRRTASSAIGEIGLALWPRRGLRATSTSSKNFLRACAKQKAAVMGVYFFAGSNSGLKPL